MIDPVDYHAERAAIERQRAASATSEATRRVHQKLAELHESAVKPVLIMARDDIKR